ncbi:MAG TPA: lysine-sensitive aspartokinase 3 [Vicinamibacterales bacterium]|nr:lysine-sensitive aspartokinase 3 [Vicinamibacterales bacterium]
MALAGPIVMKFGGTSVADADAIARVIGIVKGARSSSGLPPVVIVSAMSGVTDRLLELTEAAELRRDAHVLNGVAELSRRHFEALERLLPPEAAGDVLTEIAAQLDDLRALLKATGILRAASPSAHDAIVCTGELMNSRIMAAALEHAGVATAWVDARRTIVTDGAHTAAAPLAPETRDAVAREIVPRVADGRVPVLGGFVGATIHGVTTTLGRGGSDYSAAIIGAALDAREIQIWTDVDGMLTADPRVVAKPHVVPHLSFGEASELAYFGAKVLHPSTILPAVAKDIPVRILNSRRPEAAGTIITAEPPAADRPLAAVACKRHVTMVEITSTRMLMAHGFLRRVFEIFERYRTAVDVVTTSEVSVSVTVDDDRGLDDIVGALREFAEVSVEAELAILCAVGDNLRTDPRIAARVIGALEGFRVRMVSQAASRRNVTIVLSDADLGAAMSQLHDEFFQEAGVRRA